MVENKNYICDEISEEIICIAENMAFTDGPRNVNVRKIINAMGVTNRVFYNRFSNINEVLEIVYRRAVLKMRESIKSEFDINKDFFSYVTDVSLKVLINTFDVKKRFSQFAFEFDSYTDENYRWWTQEIKNIVDYAKSAGKVKNIDSSMLSYTIWCFFRGFNADVVNRGISREEAVDKFKFGLNCLFEGIKQ